jgi:hypothetical protein
MDLVNKGVIHLHRDPDGKAGRGARKRTLVVSGIARSGTSMIARVLSRAGVYMGENLDDVVFEDSAFALMLETGSYDPSALARVVSARNAAYPVWGFKRPHLHQHGPDIVDSLRNPRVVLTVRDPVAIAERNAIAEQYDAVGGLDAAVTDLRDMLAFANRLRCPVLLVSYEKAVSMPEVFLDELLQFCGLVVPAAKREDLLRVVEPNRPEYIGQARRVFEGYVDRIDGTVLSGWAWQKGVPLPVPITVLRDGVAVVDAMADHMREDLRRSAIGDGRHGFQIDLADKGFTPESRVAVRIGGRSFSLINSGSTVADLGG